MFNDKTLDINWMLEEKEIILSKKDNKLNYLKK